MMRRVPDSSNPNPSRRARVLGYGSLALLLVAIIPAIIPAPPSENNVGGQISVCQEQIGEIGLSLNTFHLEQGTDTAPYPSDLRQLESMGFITNLSELLRVPDRGPTGQHGDWLYFSAADSENPEAVLLISPAIRTWHVVLRTDLSVDTIRKDQLQGLINAQPVPPDPIPETR